MNTKIIILTFLISAIFSLEAMEGPEIFDFEGSGRILTHYHPTSKKWKWWFKRCRRSWRCRNKNEFCARACRCKECDNRSTLAKKKRCRRRRKCCFWKLEFEYRFNAKCSNYTCPGDADPNQCDFTPFTENLASPDKRCLKYFFRLGDPTNSGGTAPTDIRNYNFRLDNRPNNQFGNVEIETDCTKQLNPPIEGRFYDEVATFIPKCYPNTSETATSTSCSAFSTCTFPNPVFSEEIPPNIGTQALPNNLCNILIVFFSRSKKN